MSVISEPGFETVTNWTYSELDTNGVLTGSQGTGWVTEGTYSYYLITNGTPANGDYNQIKQTIIIPSNFGITIDIHKNNTDASNRRKVQVLIDTNVVWERDFDDPINEWLNQYIDLSAYTGTHDLILRQLWNNGAFSSGNNCQFDNIRETSLDNVYVNSSTGNDSNAGDSCVAGHPVQTFGVAYGLLNTGGTIHVCNSGADFSGETVTFTKGFSITVDGDGNCYLPVLS